jgi:hypothetical protein
VYGINDPECFGLKIKKDMERKQNSLGEGVESQTPDVSKLKNEKQVERKEKSAV